MEIIIYHNPNWSKSRNSVGILEKNKIAYKIIKYLDNPLTTEELKEIGRKLNLRPKHFIRKGDKVFKDLNLELNDDELLFKTMSEIPKLLERPIIINGDKACIGRPPENILKII